MFIIFYIDLLFNILNSLITYFKKLTWVACVSEPLISNSLGLEILEDVSEPDVILVCCGGGGVLSGVAAAVRLSGNSKCRIYGVEPEGGIYQICRPTIVSET